MNTQSILTTLAVALLAACSTSNKSTKNQTSPAIYTFQSDAKGFDTKTYFYDNGQEVVAFDTQFTPDLALRSIAYLRTKTQNPITYLVITHPNPDKFNGINVFKKEGAKVISSHLTKDALPKVHKYKRYFFVDRAKMFKEEDYPQLGNVDQSFEGKFDLVLKNGEKVFLHETNIPGVSSNQTLAFVPAQNSVIVGDLVHYKAHAWLEGGIVSSRPTPSIKGWIQNLALMQKEYPSGTTVLGGRGDAAPVNVAVTEQINYLNKADAIVTNYVKKLGSKKAELKTDKAAAHHKKIADKFVKEFPTYKLPYMIEYSIYSLAQSKI